MVAGNYNEASIYPSGFGILHNNNVSLKHLLCGEAEKGKLVVGLGNSMGNCLIVIVRERQRISIRSQKSCAVNYVGTWPPDTSTVDFLLRQ